MAIVIAVIWPVGRAVTVAWWGPGSVSDMSAGYVATAVPAALAVLPIPIVARFWPTNVGFAVFAGTGVRLLLTMFAALGYQLAGDIDLRRFLIWLVIFYTVLLAAETAGGAILVWRLQRRATTPKP